MIMQHAVQIHIEWMERETWRENGLEPPLPNTDAERLWQELDRPVPYKKARWALILQILGFRVGYVWF
jgi:hypothetical protein